MKIMKKTIAAFVLVAAAAVCAPLSAEVSVTRLKGDASVWDAAGGRWRPILKNEKIEAGSHVRTSRRSSVEGETPQKHKIKIDENTRVIIEEADRTSSVISIISGRMRSWVKKLKPADKYQVKTPISVISVRGTIYDVSYDETGKTSKVDVLEGVVEAREETTGAEVLVRAGESLTMREGVAPSAPEPTRSDGAASGISDSAVAARQAVRAEMFDEISRDAVLSRAAQEMKAAEYQNGKALVDARGLRVRMEEYIVRPADNQFKYVALNTRDDRFDFGKILFTFSGGLPSDLTLATRTMFESEGAEKPSLYLTGVDSVMSNTVDKVNEIAAGGDMYPDDALNPSRWTMFPGSYDFYVNDIKRWGFADANADGRISASELSYYNSSGGKISAPTAELGMPSGGTAFHFYQKNVYADGFWIAASDYIINDDGKIITVADMAEKTSSELKDFAYKLNFQREYTSSAFTNASAKNSDGNITIDLVFSSKLLIDSGMLSLPDPKRYSAPSY
ncbi:MAG: hypothetical protein CVU77_01995 [Elusimicrobia bacterium HGW-Elusimicrobia-1]|jgi:hypothetical protein|nr:MAG: hypothetical protein CVU77_01995 [Elusimicrobia bacterium HGW-Elusimicrobia-1]